MEATTSTEVLPELLTRVNKDKPVKRQIVQISLAQGKFLAAKNPAERTVALNALHTEILKLPPHAAHFHRAIRAQVPIDDKSLLIPWGTPPGIDELYRDFLGESELAALLIEYSKKALQEADDTKTVKVIKSASNTVQNKTYPVVGNFVAKLINGSVKPEFIVLSLSFILENFLTPEFLKDKKFDSSQLIGALIRGLYKLLFTEEEKTACEKAVAKMLLQPKNKAFDHDQREYFLRNLQTVFQAELAVKNPLPECANILKILFSVVMNPNEKEVNNDRRKYLVNALRHYFKWQTERTPESETIFFSNVKLCDAEDQASFRRFCVETPVVVREVQPKSPAAQAQVLGLFSPSAQTAAVSQNNNNGDLLSFLDTPNPNLPTVELKATPVATQEKPLPTFVPDRSLFENTKFVWGEAPAEKISPKKEEPKKGAIVDADGDVLDVSTEESSEEKIKPAPAPVVVAKPVVKAAAVDEDDDMVEKLLTPKQPAPAVVDEDEDSDEKLRQLLARKPNFAVNVLLEQEARRKSEAKQPSDDDSGESYGEEEGSEEENSNSGSQNPRPGRK
ncbi:MAG TPA: hypothetical protein VGV92_09640 [Gammaproteobacteria bacterium]|nr:hypothetical protein [Gammaproteobacteria bacterium]